MNIEFDSAEETRELVSEFYKKRKKKELKPVLRGIKKKISYVAKNGKSETQVDIPEYLEEEVVSLLISNGYVVNQLEKYSWTGCYAGNPPYIVSWENKGE